MSAKVNRACISLFFSLGVSVALAGCGGGNSGAGSATLPPTPQSQEYLFTAAAGQVFSFKLDSTTGALGTPISVNGPTFSEGMVTDPAAKFLYAADMQNDQIYVFAISSTGTLSQISGSPYTVGTPAASPLPNAACGLAMDSTGKFLYTADFGNDVVTAFNVDSSSGRLSPLAGSPFSAGENPALLVVDGSNKFLYVGDYGANAGGVWGFSRNTTSGALTPIPGSSPFLTKLNGGPLGLTTHGDFLWGNEQNADGTLAGFSFDSTSGALTQIPGASLPSGDLASGSVLDASGRFLYVASYGDSTISAFNVNGDGSLTAMNGSPFATTGKPYFLVIDPSGKFLYASNPDATQNTITGFTINSSNGALTQFSSASVVAGSQPTGLTVATVQQ